MNPEKQEKLASLGEHFRDVVNTTPSPAQNVEELAEKLGLTVKEVETAAAASGLSQVAPDAWAKPSPPNDESILDRINSSHFGTGGDAGGKFPAIFEADGYGPGSGVDDPTFYGEHPADSE